MNEPGHALTVWIGDQVAGHLHHHPATNRFAFAYADAWRETRGALALGPQLPLTAPIDQSPDQHSAIVRQFFENLLPEGDALDHAAQAHGVSKSNLLGLIHALRLAPAYDMVCIPALKDAQLSGTLAMAVGDAFTEAEITPFDWAQLGQQAGLRPSAMAQQMTGLIGKVTEALKVATEVTQKLGVSQDTIDAVSRHVIEACDRHRTAATQLKAIKPDWL